MDGGSRRTGIIPFCGDFNAWVGDERQEIGHITDDGKGCNIIVRTLVDKRINMRGQQIRNLCNEHELIIANGTKDTGGYTRMQGESHTILDLTILQIKEWKQYRKITSQFTIWSDHAIVRTDFRMPK